MGHTPNDGDASLGSGNSHHPKIFVFHKLDNKFNKDYVSGPFYLVNLLSVGLCCYSYQFKLELIMILLLLLMKIMLKLLIMV